MSKDMEKVDPVLTETELPTEPKAEKVPKTTKEILDAQEKVLLMIPRPDGDNSNGVFISINEVNYQIAFDEPVMVPRSVKQVWEDKKEAEKKNKAFVAEQHRIEEELKKKTGASL